MSNRQIVINEDEIIGHELCAHMDHATDIYRVAVLWADPGNILADAAANPGTYIKSITLFNSAFLELIA